MRHTMTTPPPEELAAKLERLLAFMSEIGGQAEACWITLTGLPVEDASLPAVRAYYVIGRSPQVLGSWCYVNSYPRYAGAQIVMTAGRRHGIHVRVIAYRDDALSRVLLAGYASADPMDLPPAFTRVLTENEAAHLLYAFANSGRGEQPRSPSRGTRSDRASWAKPQQFPTFSPQNP